RRRIPGSTRRSCWSGLAPAARAMSRKHGSTASSARTSTGATEPRRTAPGFAPRAARDEPNSDGALADTSVPSSFSVERLLEAAEEDARGHLAPTGLPVAG